MYQKPISIFILFLLGSSTQIEMDAMLQVQEKARRELECNVCLEVPRRKAQVFSCLQHHLICSECNKHEFESCPVCRQNFRETPRTRNRLAEKMIEQLV
jgi:galactose-1-phosphate uridylyltransferase